ncbi:AAA family ATPase, partial [Vibrio agarivorans]
MHQNYKRLLTPFLLMGATQISSVVQAEGIRLIGPSGEVRTSPSFAVDTGRSSFMTSDSDQPSRFFGPTRNDETLWSIASRLRPSSSVSVQQTLLAFYKINPQAFDNQNIHELIPGSSLRVPTLGQIQSASTEQAIAIMNAHQDRLHKLSPSTSSLQSKAPVTSSKVEVPKSDEIITTNKPVVSTEQKSASVKTASTSSSLEPKSSKSILPKLETSNEGEQQIVQLKDKLQKGSIDTAQLPQTELSALEEKNHRLRLMLSEVQNEVESLKLSLNDQDRIRTEVEKLLAEERQNIQEQLRIQPSVMDSFLSNGWLVGLVGIIPGALLALIIIFVLGRRKNAQQAQSDPLQSSQGLEPLAAPVGLAVTGAMTDDPTADKEFFGQNTEHKEGSSAVNQLKDAPDQNDVFADLNDDEFDFNLEDDDPFANISDDGSLNLNSDELDKTNDIQGDLEADIKVSDADTNLDKEDDPLGFDLSDESPSDSLSAEAFSELLAADDPEQDLQGGAVEQSMLDDLLTSVADDEMTSATDTEEVDNQDKSAEQDIDDLLAEFEVTNTQEADLQSDPLQEEHSLQSSMAEASDLENISDNENQFENINDDATALLDELLDEHNDNSFDELDSLQELEDIAGLSEEPSLADDSTELLDELLDFEDDASLDQAFDPLDELENLTDFGQETAITELDENSVELLDELLDEGGLDTHLSTLNNSQDS